MIVQAKMTINRVGPLSCARIAGVIYGAIGLLIGAFISLFAVLGMAISSTQPGIGRNPMSPLIGAVMGIGAIVFCPVFYGALGFVLALIGSWLYNLIATKVGGIEVDIS
jgi:hypothetical protein